MKNVTKVITLVLICILTFILQMYVAEDLTLFGIKANLFLVMSVALAIWVSPSISIPFVFVIGLFSDVIFTYSVGRGLVTNLVIMAIIIYMSKLYNKQKIRVAIVIMIIATLIAECMFWIFDGIYYGQFQNLFKVIFMSIKEAVLNVPLLVIYRLMFKKMAEEE